MREWNLKSGDPLCLTLATDARLEPTDYYNDQIWELRLGGGTPPSLAFQTTYGLRARSLRLFPGFYEGETMIMDPSEFSTAPVVKQLYPNFIQISFSPFLGIDVMAAYWIPQSQAATGRIWITNNSKMARQITLDWIGQLAPSDGQRMTPVEIQAASVLSGITNNLIPVVFMTGGPKASSGSYPALRLELDLDIGETRQFTWAHAALSDENSSFTLARSIVAQQWEAERSRLEMLNSGLVEIFTGDKDWDIAFMLAQNRAFNSFVGPTASLPFPSFVLNRLPDQGYSLRGDGSDYNHLWRGQSPLDSYFLTSLILPTATDLAQGIIYNYLATQDDDGFIDWKPGLGGQRSKLLATPLLSTITWRIYEFGEDRVFLEKVFPGLLRFFHNWLTPEHDRDMDGIPEWDHPMQTDAEDHPVFSYWSESGQGLAISTIESPALNAFLYQECQSLIKIATAIQQVDVISELQILSERFFTAVEESWSEKHSSYLNRDRDSHLSQVGEILAQNIGPAMILIGKTFNSPVRLKIQLNTTKDTMPYPQIFIHGTNVSGRNRIEKVTADQFIWNPGRGVFTGQNLYTSIDQIEVGGIEASDEISIFTVNTTWLDHTLLVPLWAMIPDNARANTLINETITNPERFWRNSGLTACPELDANTETSYCNNVHVIWNQLVGEGLVAYGYRHQAAELLERIMEAIIKNLKQEGAFQRYYDADSGRGIGEVNSISGLPPLGLFMKILGVRIISVHKVVIEGFNPFPWPITIKYRGMTVVRQREQTVVVFPDGQTVNVDDSEPKIISLE